MTDALRLAAQWRVEIEKLKASIPLWESGKMHTYSDGVDVTPEYIVKLKWMINNLEEGAAILESGTEG